MMKLRSFCKSDAQQKFENQFYYNNDDDVDMKITDKNVFHATELVNQIYISNTRR